MITFVLVLVGVLVLGTWALVVLALTYAEAERRKLATAQPPRRAGARYTAHADLIRVPKSEATDGLYDTSPRHLAGVFGNRTTYLLRAHRPVGEVYEAAKLAASYAFRAAPELKSSLRPTVVVLPMRPFLVTESNRVH